MATLNDLQSRIRKFRRQGRLVVFRSSTPTVGADFFVQRLAGPGGETNGIEITGLKFTFAIERDLSKHPNRCDINIVNLAPKTRAAMETDPLTVDLSAGHDGVNRFLFVGDVLHAYSKQSGADVVTTLQVGDAARAYRGSRVNRSYKRGTTVKTILRDAAKSMGQVLPSNIEASAELDAQVASGTSLTGATRDEITRILSPYGYTWSTQSGRIQILRDSDSRNDVFIIDEASGMLDSPDYKKPPKSGKAPNMNLRMLLYPELVPGGKVDVQSLAIRGLFKIVKVKHSGDTEGDEWFTDLELKPL